MKLPKKIKTKWLKALRSGKYKQGRYAVYNPKEKSFCCLGVLQHVTMGGNCELKKYNYHSSNSLAGAPSLSYWNSIGAKVNESRAHPGKVGDAQVKALIRMNDGTADAAACNFAKIADYIDKNIATI